MSKSPNLHMTRSQHVQISKSSNLQIFRFSNLQIARYPAACRFDIHGVQAAAKPGAKRKAAVATPDAATIRGPSPLHVPSAVAHATLFSKKVAAAIVVEDDSQATDQSAVSVCAALAVLASSRGPCLPYPVQLWPLRGHSVFWTFGHLEMWRSGDL